MLLLLPVPEAHPQSLSLSLSERISFSRALGEVKTKE